MLNPNGLILLSELPANRVPFALRLFADYDLSVPKLLIPGVLDERYGWKSGTAQRVIDSLVDCGLLVGSRLLRVSPMYRWTPEILSAQWAKMRQAEERERLVAR